MEVYIADIRGCFTDGMACRRLQVNRLEIAINFDAGLDALRDYFARSVRESHARGTHLDLNASNPESSAPDGYQPLEVQLEALEAFHAWWVGKMRVFKVSCLTRHLCH